MADDIILTSDDETEEPIRLTIDEQGSAFYAAVLESGVTVDYGNMTLTQIQHYWNAMSEKYNGADWDGTDPKVKEFGDDLGFVCGGSVTQDYEYSGDSIISDTDNSIEYLTSNSLRVLTDSGYVIVTVDAVDMSNSKNCGYKFLITSKNEGASSGYTKEYWLYTNFSNFSSDDSTATAFWRPYIEKRTSVGGTFNDLYIHMESHGRYKSYNHQIKDYVYYNRDFTKNSDRVAIINTTVFPITFHIDDYGGTGGGGSGGYWTSVLEFTSTSGLSGRHNDPLNDTTYSYLPTPKTTSKKHGCGGDGGNGGGGGAGSATVVIYSFNTSKSENVTQKALTQRHGYGSGGGAGGKGGDGCILIFY